IGHRGAGVFTDDAKLVVLTTIINPNYQAIGIERQIMTLLFPLIDKSHDFVKICKHARLSVGGYSKATNSFVRIRPGRQLAHILTAQIKSPELQWPLGDETRIELPDCPGGQVARICKYR